MEAFVKIQKHFFFQGGGGGVRGGASGWGVRVDVNGEVKFLRKLKKKNEGGGWVRVGGGVWGGQGGSD